MTISTDANLAVAGGTIILAFFTWRAAAASRKAAQATERAAASGREAAEASRQAAEAAQDEADATVQLAQEARKDRELAWRPHLSLTIGRRAVEAGSHRFEVTVTNVGNGPALGCRIWLYQENSFTWRDLEPLAAQQSLPVPEPLSLPGPWAHPFPEGMFDPPAGGRPHREPWVIVATCTDVLGNRWRFMHGQQPERVRPDERNPPPWIKNLGIHPTDDENTS